MDNKFIVRLLLSVTTLSPTVAAEVHHAVVSHDKGVYTVAVDALINAEWSEVRALVTDYGNLDRLSDILLETTLLPGTGPQGEKRLSLRAETCFLIFCFKVRAQGEIMEHTPTHIITTVNPDESDFRSSVLSWRILPDPESGCRIYVTGSVEPDFWIPPLIGPLLIRRKIIREGNETIATIEKLLGDE